MKRRKASLVAPDWSQLSRPSLFIKARDGGGVMGRIYDRLIYNAGDTNMMWDAQQNKWIGNEEAMRVFSVTKPALIKPIGGDASKIFRTFPPPLLPLPKFEK
jgi:hypothetical protein